MLDYNFYREKYRGSSIPAAEWSTFSARAAEQLAHYKRIYSVSAPEKDSEALAICAMADSMAFFVAAQNGTGGAVASASIGSVSVSYGGTTVDLSPKAQEKELYRCARKYLEISRGVG